MVARTVVALPFKVNRFAHLPTTFCREVQP
jgi:hypothetical protein